MKNAGHTGLLVAIGGGYVVGADFSSASLDGLVSSSGALVHATNVNVSGCGRYGIECRLASLANAFSADATGAGTRGIYAHQGSIVTAQSSSARRNPASDGASDYFVGNGGMIAANSGVGGTNVTPNTVSAAGIIFK